MIEFHFLHWEVQVFLTPIINGIKYSFWVSVDNAKVMDN